MNTESKAYQKYQCEGQLSIFDIDIAPPRKKEEPKKPIQWHRFERQKPKEDQRVLVMYTWTRWKPGDRTGQCVATWHAGKFVWEGLPWDIGKVCPEAWRELRKGEYEQ